MRMGRLKASGALLSLAIFLAGSPLRGQTPAAAFAQAAEQENAALPVVAVRMVAQDGRVLSAAPADLPIALGQPLDPAAVRDALRKLYRTGDYADLQAVRTAVPGGLRLDFVVRENLFFNLVRIEGLTAPPSESTAAAAMQISIGHPYHKDDVDEALGRLLETLQEEGLYEAKVSAEDIPHPETQQMDVLVHVIPGPRARIGEIRLLNHTGFPGLELLERARFAPGRAVTLARLQTGGERLRKYLARKGYLSARAVMRRGAYDPAKKTVPLELEVTEGPHVRVVVSGAKFSSRALKKLVPIYQEGAVDPDLLEEGRRNLRERLERDGYFDAEVSYSAETHEQKKNAGGWTAQEKIITYRIERGDRHKLVGIEISGNRYFSDETLRSRLRLVPAAFASRRHSAAALLEDDAQSMQAVYRDNGFRAAPAWMDRSLQRYRGTEGDLLIRFAVQEGAQTQVASLTLDGNHAFSTEELVGVLGV